MTAPKTVLGTLRDRVRRAQFIIVLGWISLVIGVVLTQAPMERLRDKIGGTFVGLVVGLLLARLWLLVVLPVMAYGASRVIELRPWTTAVGAALAGEVFDLGVAIVSQGFDGLFAAWPRLLVRLGTLAAGILLTERAVKRGRKAAVGSQDKARAVAESKKDQYAEFTREAERIAALREASQLASATVAPVPAAPGAVAAVARDAVAPAPADVVAAPGAVAATPDGVATVEGAVTTGLAAAASASPAQGAEAAPEVAVAPPAVATASAAEPVVPAEGASAVPMPPSTAPGSSS